VPKKRVANLYETILLIREVENYIVEAYPTDIIKSPVHLSIGQEWIAAAICEDLSSSDYISNTYRGHATYIAKGGDLNAMIAELHGKAGGCGGGKAGSMHLIDIKNGVLGCSAVVGTTIPVASGWALAQKWSGQKSPDELNIVVTVFGDGATEEGAFAESLNFAALHKLPQVFICENNKLAIHQPLSKRWARPDLVSRTNSYGIPSHKVTSGDTLELSDLMADIYMKVRTPGFGPAFVEVEAYRWLEHVGITDDHDQTYRNKDDGIIQRQNDQLDMLASQLSEKTLLDIQKNVETIIKTAIKFAEDSPFPDKSDLLTFNYA